MSDTPDQLTLEELMQQAQLGDKNSYTRLLTVITPVLRSFIRKKLNHTQDAEDVLQEILISIHQASHTYDASRSFKKWMFAIARYRLADYLRNWYATMNRDKTTNPELFADLEPDSIFQRTVVVFAIFLIIALL